MAKRTRQRNRSKPQPAPVDAEQDLIEDMAGELLVLWRALSAALARDSAGQLTSDRQPKGAREGSAATVNVDVVDAAVRIETGVAKLAAEAVPILNLDRRPRSVADVLAKIPDWRRSLAARDQPLAGYIHRDLESWLRDVRQAIGVQRHDERLGVNCPDHRDTKPTELRIEGPAARIAPSLLDGPPRTGHLLIGATCAGDLCGHSTCIAIRERRLCDTVGRLTDWLATAAGPAWSSADGAPAFEWTVTGTVRCRHCRRTWTTVNERRILVAELRALGDKFNRSMEAIIA